MDEKALKELQETKDYWSGFMEAPVSDSFKWVDPQGFEHLSTLRAWSPSNLISQFTKFQSALLAMDCKPISSQQKVTPAPAAQIQERDDLGLPVIDGDGKPSMINLPQGVAVYTIKGFYHGNNKAGDKDFLCVVVNEKPHNGKFGHKMFHPPFNDWKAWPISTGDTPGLFSVPGYTKAVIQDPEEGKKYAEVLELRA